MYAEFRCAHGLVNCLRLCNSLEYSSRLQGQKYFFYKKCPRWRFSTRSRSPRLNINMCCHVNAGIGITLQIRTQHVLQRWRFRHTRVLIRESAIFLNRKNFPVHFLKIPLSAQQQPGCISYWK